MALTYRHHSGNLHAVAKQLENELNKIAENNFPDLAHRDKFRCSIDKNSPDGHIYIRIDNHSEHWNRWGINCDKLTFTTLKSRGTKRIRFPDIYMKCVNEAIKDLHDTKIGDYWRL